MGFLSWLNRNADISDLAPTDRGFVVPEGRAGHATVVGIEYKLDDGTTKRYIAVSDGTRMSGSRSRTDLPPPTRACMSAPRCASAPTATRSCSTTPRSRRRSGASRPPRASRTRLSTGATSAG